MAAPVKECMSSQSNVTVKSMINQLEPFCGASAEMQKACEALQQWQLCARCVLRFLGVTQQFIYRFPVEDIQEAVRLLSLWKSDKQLDSVTGSPNAKQHDTETDQIKLDMQCDTSDSQCQTPVADGNDDMKNDEKVDSENHTADENGKLSAPLSNNPDTDKSNENDTASETNVTGSSEESGNHGKNDVSKMSVCVTCLGILTKCCEDEFLEKVKEEVFKAGYQIKNYSCSVSTPVTLILREKAVWVSLKQILPSIYKRHKLDDCSAVKEIWKWTTGMGLSEKLKVPFEYKSPFEISINFTHSEVDKECSFLLDIFPDDFKRRKGHNYSSEMFNRTNVAKAVGHMTDEKFSRNYSCPPNVSSSVCGHDGIKCSHEPLYVAGRYNKYNRCLSQTPWIIDGVRKTESSVQELICASLVSSIKSEDCKFSSSGREDVDVKMLGKGRPFMVEFINPHVITFCQEEISKIQKDINDSTEDIKVRDLQIVTKEDTQVLKQGEEEKTKSYSALCWSKDPVTQEQLDSVLAGVKDLKLDQKTPIRVLHRVENDFCTICDAAVIISVMKSYQSCKYQKRTLALRERMIHSLSASVINAHHFTLRLSTQAGTYIKEFVHGDFGRTVPDLGTLLNTECDILELDVESVELDWPKSLDP